MDRKFLTIRVTTGIVLIAGTTPDRRWVDYVSMETYNPDDFLGRADSFPIFADNYPCTNVNYFNIETPKK